MTPMTSGDLTKRAWKCSSLIGAEHLRTVAFPPDSSSRNSCRGGPFRTAPPPSNRAISSVTALRLVPFSAGSGKFSRILATLLVTLACAFPALAQPAYQDETAKRHHVFPQLAAGGGFQSVLLVTNVAPSESRCALTLGGQLTTNRFRTPAPTDLHPVELISDSTAFFRLSDAAPFVWPTTNGADRAVGYARLSCSAPVVAQVLYATKHPSGTSTGMATVFSSQAATVFRFPVLAQETPLGIAIANWNSSDDVSCDFVLENLDRLNSGEATLSIPGFSNVAKLLHEVVPLPASFTQGWVTVTCDQYVSMIGLHFDGTLFTTLPPAILPPPPDRSSGQLLDRQALKVLYDATDGPNWNQAYNWNTDEELGQWHGVRTDGTGRVIRLNLQGNYLSGPIPAELGHLTRLEELLLDNNELSGPIPAELGKLTSLRELGLNNNYLSGTIPAELGRLVFLELGLNLSSNQLSGPIPAELGHLINLEELRLDNNELSGPIPAELGHLTRLQNLHLYKNELSGPIPAELGHLTRLRVLEIWENQLSGPVPAELGNLINLRQLNLDNNELSGTLPSSLTNLMRLRLFSFHENAGLCAPTNKESDNWDEEFENWLNGVPDVSGPSCGTP